MGHRRCYICGRSGTTDSRDNPILADAELAQQNIEGYIHYQCAGAVETIKLLSKLRGINEMKTNLRFVLEQHEAETAICIKRMCSIHAVFDCDYGNPKHYSADGCPICDDVE